ncbi:hypothetical protein PHMEG_00015314 [Phytophthora megakarya]|uniref:PiggyBac transposable element-derived protein domain-containing protein n=1 Tax=Phytophthora megakarya TaxID=4795 RepID=A0A225W467_9STRA|nr:hypothetical protein PHMEG_00015314 [Phytophthora megakarya]
MRQLITLYLDLLYLYTFRIEVYCGKAQQTNEVGNVPKRQQSVDPNTGPVDVIRNLESVLPEQQGDVYHLVVTDRFYISVQLAYQLLSRNIYSIGTIMGDKVGYPQEIVEKNRTRPKRTPHETSNNCPLMTAALWWDRNPVQFLGTGSSREMDTCLTRTRGSRGIRNPIPCPSMICDYHNWMGGVDVHDQLRLQCYSIQMQTWCKKYYKSIFMGLVDAAVVNAYIVFKEAQKRNGGKPSTHAEFLLELHSEMLALGERDFAIAVSLSCYILNMLDMWQRVCSQILVVSSEKQYPEYQVVNGVRKHR